MGHEQQERYSNLVLAKLRASLVLKDGVVFNNDYEGKPTAGAVKIPTRDTEVAISDYDKANGIAATNGKTDYVTLPIDKDKAVNETRRERCIVRIFMDAHIEICGFLCKLEQKSSLKLSKKRLYFWIVFLYNRNKV